MANAAAGLHTVFGSLPNIACKLVGMVRDPARCLGSAVMGRWCSPDQAARQAPQRRAEHFIAFRHVV